MGTAPTLKAKARRTRASPKRRGGDAREFAGKYANGLTAGRQFPVHQFLHCTGIGHVVGEGREVVQPVRVGDKLVVGHVLRDLFVTAVKEASVGFGSGNHFAIKFQDEAQDPVCGGVGWPHVENHLFSKEIFGSGLVVRGCLRRVGGSIGSLVDRCGGGLAHLWDTTRIRTESG